MMNKFLLTIIGVSFFSNYVNAEKHVAITQIVNHPALNAVRDSCIATIQKCQDIPDKIKITTTDANGNLVLAGQIAQSYLSERPDVIVAIATPSAQTVLNAVRDQIPLVFAAVTDPVQAKLV